MNFTTTHRWVRRAFVTFAITSTTFLIWGVQARGVPDAMFESDGQVRVERTDYGRLFTPATATDTAVVFLPGGLVDPDAYVPFVRGLAAQGLPAALVEVPRRGAMPTEAMRQTLWMRIRDARTAFAGRRLVLAGHSLGGMFASVFAADNPSAIDALVLIGTTHPRDRDLSRGSWPVLKVLGSEDCVASTAGARANAPMLPPSTQWVEIGGGNHRQFAYYGWQIGDCAATISREQQHAQAITVITAFLDAHDAPAR